MKLHSCYFSLGRALKASRKKRREKKEFNPSLLFFAKVKKKILHVGFFFIPLKILDNLGVCVKKKREKQLWWFFSVQTSIFFLFHSFLFALVTL